ncbi:MAG: hypothetical protein AB7T49_09860 [Oligoflexales bacterium]
MMRRKISAFCLLFLLSYQMSNCRSLQKDLNSSLKTDQNAFPPQLEAKLMETHAEFLTAGAYLSDKVSRENGTVDRTAWEGMLPTYQSFTAEEKSVIEEHLRAIAAESKKTSDARSLLGLDSIRNQEAELKNFCSTVPKGGMLHIHPWGTVDQATLEEILAKVNPKFDLKVLIANLQTGGAFGRLYPDEMKFLGSLSKKYAVSDAPEYKCNTKAPQPSPDESCPTYNALSNEEKDQIKRLYFLPKAKHEGVPRFDRFLGSFTITSATVFQSRKNVDPEKIMYDAFFKRAKNLGVSYVEITQFLGRDYGGKKWLPSLNEWADQIQSQFGITAKLLAAYTRAKEPEDIRKSTLQMFERLKADLPLSSSGQASVLVGVNLLADETTNPALEKGQTLYPLVRDLRDSRPLGMSMHAGELGDVRNVRDAIIMGVDRVGHGVKLREDVVTLELARRYSSHLGIETNIMSNVLLDVVPDVRSHPFLEYLRLGFAVSFSTDDEGMFESTIADECMLAVKETNINYCELQKAASNSIKSSFASAEEKAKLLNGLRTDFAAFEAKWSNLKRDNPKAASCL